jgi:F-type H+-transporting ATPase subunit b
MSKVEKSSKLASDLTNKFDAIFPTWPTIVATLLSLLIIVIVLTKFLYNPIKKIHDERRKYINDNIQTAIKENTNAILDREEANNELIKARLKAKEIINVANEQALELKNKNIEIVEKEVDTKTNRKIIEDFMKVKK